MPESVVDFEESVMKSKGQKILNGIVLVGGMVGAVLLWPVAMATTQQMPARAVGIGIEQTFVGDGILVGSVAYPDGGAVDVILTHDDQAQFLAVLADGGTKSAMALLPCAAERAVMQAGGRVVHLVTEGACGIYHWRWEIPEGMWGLNGGRVLMPVVTWRAEGE